MAVAGYGLQGASVLGDYKGQLPNGRGTVTLFDPTGRTADSLRYGDGFPWPSAADGLGAGESWLPPGLLPLAAHRHRGVSLERYSFQQPGGSVANWGPSPVDGATPGRANTVTGAPPVIALALSVAADSADASALIRSADPVVVRASFSEGTLAGAALQYFVDDSRTHRRDPGQRAVHWNRGRARGALARPG